MSIMENYMKEGAATCHPLYFQLFKPIPSQTQISSTLVKINQHSKTRPSQAGSCISKTSFHMFTYIYIFSILSFHFVYSNSLIKITFTKDYIGK